VEKSALFFGKDIAEESDAGFEIGLGRGAVVDVVADGGLAEQTFDEAPELLVDGHLNGRIVRLAKSFVSEEASELGEDLRTWGHGASEGGVWRHDRKGQAQEREACGRALHWERLESV